MIRRVFTSVICVALLCCCLLPVQAFAAYEEEFQIDVMTILLTYITSATSDFDISGGQAIMSSLMYANGVDQVRMANYLQKLVNGSWTSVTSWSKTENATSASWSNTYSVTSGTYRLKTYYYAYINGTVVESTSRTSASDSY